jgi:hypothetical protein
VLAFHPGENLVEVEAQQVAGAIAWDLTGSTALMHPSDRHVERGGEFSDREEPA